jgi:hypothetical protein
MRRFVLAAASIAALTLTCASGDSGSGPRGPGTRSTELPKGERVDVFKGGLVQPWSDWGWAKREVKRAPARVLMESFAGWIIAAPGFRKVPDALLVRFRAPREKGDFLEVRLGHADKSRFPRVKVDASLRRTEQDGAEEVVIMMSALNPERREFDRVVLRPHKQLGKTWVEIEEIAFLCNEKCGAPVEEDPSLFPSLPANFSVTCGEGTPISEGVYGIAFDMLRDRKQQWLWDLKPGARRWGGNANSRFNFKRGAWNTGNDWFFENVDYMRSNRKNGWTWRTFLKENQEKGALTALSVPLVGWVAKDTKSNGFPVSVFGPQQRTDSHRPDAGNGKNKRGEKIPPKGPELTSEPGGAGFIAEWVKEIVTTREGGRDVHVWILGNEPMLWHDTHRDVHPEPVSYDELLGKTIDAARAIRALDPGGKIAGPALWGWPAYSYSAVDAEKGFWRKPDRRAHDDEPFLAWYLKQLKAHEDRTGERLLDLVDVHFYAEGLYNQKVDEETARKRLRSVRSLYDPKYVEETYIKEPVRLIPRMREIIEESYPGRGLIIGEWNFGGEKHWSGALATAEALGTFGKLGVDYAFYWTYPPKDSASWWAFRAYRDYDGAGARFPATSIPATAPKEARAFAGQDDARVVAVLLNQKRRSTRDALVSLKGCRAPAGVRAFSWDARRKKLSEVDAKLSGARAQVKLPAASVTVLEVKLGQQ